MGGKVLNSRTAHVINRVAILLRTVAPAIGRSDTWLGSFHRRMRVGLGPAGANTATAHKLACLIYHLLKYKEEYTDVDRLHIGDTAECNSATILAESVLIQRCARRSPFTVPCHPRRRHRGQ